VKQLWRGKMAGAGGVTVRRRQGVRGLSEDSPPISEMLGRLTLVGKGKRGLSLSKALRFFAIDSMGSL
jgi:hypothetical protein